MDCVEWLTPTRASRGISNADVSIRLYAYQKDTKRTRITFRNGADLKITHDAHIQVGIDEKNGRICFRDGVIYGNKVNKVKNGNTKYISIPRLLEDFVGDYDLKMSGTGDFFYVQKEG